jgi:hypothetical protein
MTNYVNKWIRTAFDNLRKVFGDKCSFCGSKENLEYAHLEQTELVGRGRGRKERYYDIKKNPDSYVLLCVVCHKTLDTVLKG